MNIGDIVKVFSSTSDYDGQTGRVIYISNVPGAPAPFVVQFGDALSEPFSERELVSMKPIEPLWRSAPLETHHAPHGASSASQIYLGRVIAQRFIRGERRRAGISLRTVLGVPCVQCGKQSCSHR